MSMKYILIIAFTLAGLAGMAQTNQPLPSGAVPFGATTYLSPLDSTIWLYKERDGTAVNLGSWYKVDSLVSLRAAYVPDIATLEAYDGDEDVVVVTDTLRGGLFVYQSLGEDDGGTIFTATGRGSGYWHRQFNKSDGLNVLWYGVDPTGVTDCAEILEDIIYLYSRKTGKVYIPPGRYRIDRGIGDLPVAGQGEKKIIHDVDISGSPGTEIFVGGSSQIAHIIGFDVLESRVRISNISMDGSGLANRGVYLRQAINTPADYSDFEGESLRVSNIHIGAGGIHNRANGINIYGKFNYIRINKCEVDGVTTSGTTYAAEGIVVNGSIPLNSLAENVSITESYVNNIRVTVGNASATVFGIRVEGDLETANIEGCVIDSVTSLLSGSIAGILLSGSSSNNSTAWISRNTVSNVFRNDMVTFSDQDGIYVSMVEPVAVTDNVSVYITNNKVINARGRAMKIQNTNTHALGNHIVLEEGFEMPSPPASVAVDFQFSAGIFQNNTFTFNNESHYIFLVNMYKRTTADNIKPVVVKGNRVYANSGMNSFVRIYEAVDQIQGHASIEDNYIDGTVAQLVQFNSASDDEGVRYVNITGNTIRQATASLISNGQSKNLSINATNNTNMASSVPISTFHVSMTNINNSGFSGSASGRGVFTGVVRAAPAVGGTDLVTLNQLNAAPFVNFTSSQNNIGGNKSWTGRHTFAPTSPGTVTQGAVDISYNMASGVFIRAGRTSSSGNAFILRGYATDGVQLDLNEGAVLAPQYRLSSLNTAPASATATGTTGEIRVTATHIYVCTATNTWVRAALTTW